MKKYHRRPKPTPPMHVDHPIDRNGFEAAAWSRKLWLSLLHVESHIRFGQLPDQQFEDANNDEREIVSQMDRFQRGFRPEDNGWTYWSRHPWTEGVA